MSYKKLVNKTMEDFNTAQTQLAEARKATTALFEKRLRTNQLIIRSVHRKLTRSNSEAKRPAEFDWAFIPANTRIEFDRVSDGTVHFKGYIPTNHWDATLRRYVTKDKEITISAPAWTFFASDRQIAAWTRKTYYDSLAEEAKQEMATQRKELAAQRRDLEARQQAILKLEEKMESRRAAAEASQARRIKKANKTEKVKENA